MQAHRQQHCPSWSTLSLTISSLTRTQVRPGLPGALQVVPHSLWGLARAIYFWSTRFCLGSEVFCLRVKQLLLLDSCRRESSCLASARGRCCSDKTLPSPVSQINHSRMHSENQKCPTLERAEEFTLTFYLHLLKPILYEPYGIAANTTSGYHDLVCSVSHLH